MSGGYFNYNQYRITEIADEIERAIQKNGKEIPVEDRWASNEHYEKYPEDKFYHNYRDEVIQKFEDAVKYLRKAQIYAQRIDRLLSGDDGEESFLTRLNDDLKEEQND